MPLVLASALSGALTRGSASPDEITPAHSRVRIVLEGGAPSRFFVSPAAWFRPYAMRRAT